MTESCISRHAIEQMPDRFRACFINCLSGFKSANLIGTCAQRGQQENVAIVSSVVHVGANPPLLGMVMRPHTVVRDTLDNINATGVYTINHVSTHWTQQAHQTSARYPSEVSEFDATGLTAWYSDTFAAPFVQQSPIKLAMQLQSITPIALNNTQFVIGSIEEVWLDATGIDESGRIDLATHNVASVAGLDTYYRASRIGRYPYAKPE